MFCCCRNAGGDSPERDPSPPPFLDRPEKDIEKTFSGDAVAQAVEAERDPIWLGPDSVERAASSQNSSARVELGGGLKKEAEKKAREEIGSATSATSNMSQPSKHQTIINVGGANPGVQSSKSPAAPGKSHELWNSQGVSETERSLLRDIEKLSQAVEAIEGAAAMGQAESRKCASMYANELAMLTSQVRREAGKMSEAGLMSAVDRLEKVAARLESLAAQTGISTGAGDKDQLAAFVTSFDDVVGAPFANYMSCSAALGGDVKTQAGLVDAVFREQRQFLITASKSKAPSQDALMSLVKPVAGKLQAVQDFRENNRRSEYFNHLSAISESVAAFGWITVSPAPGPFVKEMTDAGTFYTNRVLKDYKDKDPKHLEWVKSWIAVLNHLQDYVKDFHRTGVTWNPKGGDALSVGATSPPVAPKPGGAPPPPPPGGPPPPPPPPPADLSAGASTGGGSDSRSALFAELNKGTGVTAGLKKVSDDMKTHKNPALRATQDTGVRQGPAPFKATAPKPVSAPKPVAKPAAKPPLIELQNKKWVVEYHQGNKNIVLDNTELKQTAYVYKCVDCVVQIKGKINSITLDQCKKTAIVFEDLVSSLEFVNCQSMQGQALGKVPTISIDKTDGCMVYLSKESLDTEIVTAKSSEMNILVPVGDGDFKEFALPEQFKTTWNGKTMVTEQTDI